MKQGSESLVVEDAPTPAQLFKLSAQGIIAAKQYHRLRIRPGICRMVLPTETVLPTDIEALRDRRFEQSWAHSVRKTNFRKWSMRLISRYHIIEGNVGIGTEVQMYKFEWDTARTSLASKDTVVAPVPEYDLGDLVDRFCARDDLADEWCWREQLSQVTAGDVVLLTTELERFSGRIAFSDMVTNK